MRVKIITTVLFLLFLLNCIFFQPLTAQTAKPLSASELVQKADQMKTSGDLNQAVMLFSQAANSYLSAGNRKQASETLTLALKCNRQLGNTRGVVTLLNQLGMLAYDLENNSEAATCFSEGVELLKGTSRKADLVSMLVSLASVQLDLNRNSEALISISEATNIATALNDLRLLRSCYSTSSKVYDKLDNRKKSAEYFDLYSAVTKKIQKDEVGLKEQEATKKVEIANQQVQQVVAQKKLTEKELAENQKSLETAQEISREMQLQIELLNKDKLLNESIIARQLLMRRIYLIIISASLLIIALIYYFYSAKKKANRLLSLRNDEIMRQKEEIEQQAHELTVINDQKTKLFSIIAHDLRSPLSSLVTLMNVANAGIISDEDFKRAITDLSENVNHTASLLENLLNWARCQMQRVKVNLVTADIYEIVSEKVALVAEPAKAKGVTVLNAISEGTEAFADKDMVSLVLRNLISNAVKFCRKGDRIIVSASSFGGEVIVEVKDTGVGITPEDLGKVFGQQIFTTRGTSNELGTGLGLVLSKEFVELNGGKIWVESTLNKGTSFFFTLKEKPEVSVNAEANTVGDTV